MSAVNALRVSHRPLRECKKVQGSERSEQPCTVVDHSSVITLLYAPLTLTLEPLDEF